MAPPSLADEQVNCGPLMPERIVGERVFSLATPRGDYDLAAVAARLPVEQKPDVVVCMVDASLNNTPRNLAVFRCPKVLLVADTHHMSNPILGVLKYARSERFDRIVFLYTRHHLEMFRAAGLKNLFWFPGLTLPFSDAVVRGVRAVDRVPRLALTGQTSSLYRRRLRLVAALADAKVPVELRAMSQLRGLRFYGSSAVTLNITANADLNLRAFEALAAGSLLLMDRLTPDSGISQIWQEGREYVAYGSAEELVERAIYYLAHPEERQTIAAAGATWIDERFNSRVRREAFARLVFDATEPAGFELPVHKYHVQPFAALGQRLPAALAVYEHLQLTHSLQETVSVRLGDHVPAEIRRLCATLPRVQIVSPDTPLPVAPPDYWVTTVADGVRCDSSEAMRIWFWDAPESDIPKLTARLAAFGYRRVRSDVAYFDHPRCDEVVGLAKGKSLEAHLQLSAADAQRAFECAKQALAQNPTDCEALQVMAELALHAGHLDLFGKMCARIRGIAPTNPFPTLLGMELTAGRAKLRLPQRVLECATWQLAKGETEVALSLAQRAWKLDPSNPGTSQLLAQAHLRLAERGDAANSQSELAEALRYFRITAELEPDNPAHWRELGYALRENTPGTEVVAAWERVVSLEASEAGDWYALGDACLAQGDPLRAAEAFAAGLGCVPENAQLARALAHAVALKSARECQTSVPQNSSDPLLV